MELAKTYGGIVVALLAIALGIVALATPDWSMLESDAEGNIDATSDASPYQIPGIDFGSGFPASPIQSILPHSVGIFRSVNFNGIGYSNNLSGCEDCQALQAAAAFVILPMILAFFALCLAVVKKKDNSTACHAKMPMLLLIGALIGNLLAVVIWVAEVHSGIVEAFPYTLGYSWYLMIVATGLDAVAAALLK